MKKEICQNILAYDIPKKFQTHTRCQDKHYANYVYEIIKIAKMSAFSSDVNYF
jgi:hypothetical protein